jgi:mannose-6-phosphate isomerase-like protein (cupin superfamily)
MGIGSTPKRGAPNAFQRFKPFQPLKSLGAVLALLLVVGCSASPRVFFQHGTEFGQAELAQVLAENPLGSSENIKVTTLGYGQSVSYHIAQVRDREAPHIHQAHDSIVVMMKGRGYLMLEDRRIDLTVGDVVDIPRNAAHYYVNTASEPTVAFVIFSPPFDGKDNIPLPAR